MISEAEVKQMPLQDKLRLMEIIWDHLHRAPDTFESPEWHREELAATEARRMAGLEEPMDWDEAILKSTETHCGKGKIQATPLSLKKREVRSDGHR